MHSKATIYPITADHGSVGAFTSIFNPSGKLCQAPQAKDIITCDRAFKTPRGDAVKNK